MERMAFRSTSLVDLQAELHERDLLREARVGGHRGRKPRRRASKGLGSIVRRLFG